MKKPVVVVGTFVFAAIAIAASVYVVRWSDTIEFVDSSGTPVQATAILTQGTYNGAACQLFEGKTEYEIGQGPAQSQLTALSPTTAIYFDPNLAWTFWPRESKKITLQGNLELPVRIWRLTTTSQTPDSDAFLASQRLAEEWTGLKMKYSVEDVSSVDMPIADCSSRSTLMNTDDPRPTHPGMKIFDAGAVNIYYTNSCGDECLSNGWSCRDDRRFAFVYGGVGDTTLLHELGHSLIGNEGEDHWTNDASPNNVMRDSSSKRTEFSTGQTVVMNYEQSSVLSALKPGAPRLDCTQDCPRLEFDQAWSGCFPPKSVPVVDPAVVALFDCAECTGQQLERVVNEARENLATRDLLIKELATVLPPSDDPYENNFRARKHRRSLRALTLLAPSSPPARNAIRSAFANVTSYRVDIQPAIRAANRAPQ